MPWAVELSGEHATLPRAEARALVESRGGNVIQDNLDRVLLAEGPVDPAWLADRLALSWRIASVHARSTVDVDAIVGTADRVPLDGQRFAVRCSRLDANLPADLGPRVERALGTALCDRGTVDLEDPQVTVRVLLDRDALVGTETARVDRSAYEDRHVEARPFFSPITLHPRLARAIVNLARLEAGQRLWDPFVGTGGLALEAALVGAETIASDLDEAMVEGTRSTLTHFGVDADLRVGDVADVGRTLDPVAAIVTDPPYGRASSTNREDVHALYDRFLETAADALEPGGHLVCVLPDPSQAENAPPSLEPREQHEWYVHGSLTRHVLVFERA